MVEKILVVDDELETLRLIGVMLQRQGYEIIASASGIEAVSLAKKENPDLIILDIMMPDKDGFEVAKDLKAMPETDNIPLLMFTAKSQVEDKVTGYEVGADDYLTKPVHPAELVAHVKALLSRSPKSGVFTEEESGHTIGVLSPKGGIGCSSFVLNLAMSYQHETKEQVIAAELRPGHGAWGLDLGYPEATGLRNLLNMSTREITPNIIKEELIRTISGELLLLASYNLEDIKLINETDQLNAIVQQLPLIAPLVILDLGNPYLTNAAEILEKCDEIILLTEPYPYPIERSKILIEELGNYGFGKYKLLNIVLNNRMRSDLQYATNQVEVKLNHPVMHIISPSPENSFNAAERKMALIKNQPEGLIAQQYSQLAKMIAQHIQHE